MRKIVKQSLIFIIIISLFLAITSCRDSADDSAEFQQETRLEAKEKTNESKEKSSENDKSSQSEKTSKQEKKDNTSKESKSNSEETDTNIQRNTSKGASVDNQKAKTETTRATTVPTTTTTAPTTQAIAPPTPTTQATTTAPTMVRVSLSVDCSAAVNAGNETAKAISNNGVILGSAAYELNPGSTVYDLIMNSGLTVGARGGYIYSIQSLGEFDVNGRGGWYYYVNGVRPSYGVDQYVLQPGDHVSFQYTLDY